jgi:hypothetical protein
MLARTLILHYDSCSIECDVYAAALRYIIDLHGPSLKRAMGPKLVSIHNSMMAMRVEAAKDPIDLLIKLAGYECQDSRDRIFSIVSTFQKWSLRPSFPGKQLVDVNYESTVEAVYSQFAERCLQLDPGPLSSPSWKERILSAAGGFGRQDSHFHSNLPSWIPDWRHSRFCEPLPFINSEPLSKRGLELTRNDQISNSTLIVQGVELDTVAYTLDGFSSGFTIDSYVEYCLSEIDQIGAVPAPEGTSKRVSDIRSMGEEALRETLIASQEKTSPYIQVAETIMFSRTVFITKKGYLGISSDRIDVGDHICLFSSFRLPHALRGVRKASEDNFKGHFRLVSEAYVYGTMKDEFWKQLCIDSKKLETFHIH